MTTLADQPSGLPVATVFAAALRGVPCDAVWGDGATDELPVAAWVRVADDTDRLLLASCVGTTLDIGCGPGRMSAQLMLDGHVALGIDVVPEAVAQSRERGVTALRRDVFGRVHGDGRWQTALLADGNIGIGGDPVRLLDRIRELLAPDGIVVLELHPFGSGLREGTLALSVGGRLSESFPWAVVGADAVAGVAEGAGFVVEHTHEHSGRWWSVLRKGG